MIWSALALFLAKVAALSWSCLKLPQAATRAGAGTDATTGYSLFVSAIEPNGLAGLTTSLRESLRNERPILEVRIPAANGRMIAEVHRDGEVLDQRSEEDVIVLKARLDERSIGRLRQSGARVTVTQAVTRPRSVVTVGEVRIP